ncbi:chlorophyll a/b-binding protein domain-containing protein [Pelagophyceae sp. CCMP2097]|nr:chlorophyll a/b-binding protein domain-containing protein [Pelagophyceae sp. CCMP2097]
MLSSITLSLALAAVSGFSPAPVQRQATHLADLKDGQNLDSVGFTADRGDIYAGVGVTEFPGFFDPFGLADGKSAERKRYFREAELKHGRVCMLASVGFLVGESFHPLFGGNVYGPSFVAFQSTPLQSFWPIVVLAIGAIEAVTSIPTFENPLSGGWWVPKADHVSGDFGFDPLGLKPTGAEYKEMATKEINNGRLAMIGVAGMVAQELVDGSTIFAGKF